jgi:hypothetical protein
MSGHSLPRILSLHALWERMHNILIILAQSRSPNYTGSSKYSMKQSLTIAAIQILPLWMTRAPTIYAIALIVIFPRCMIRSKPSLVGIVAYNHVDITLCKNLRFVRQLETWSESRFQNRRAAKEETEETGNRRVSQELKESTSLVTGVLFNILQMYEIDTKCVSYRLVTNVLPDIIKKIWDR